MMSWAHKGRGSAADPDSSRTTDDGEVHGMAACAQGEGDTINEEGDTFSPAIAGDAAVVLDDNDCTPESKNNNKDNDKGATSEGIGEACAIDNTETEHGHLGSDGDGGEHKTEDARVPDPRRYFAALRLLARELRRDVLHVRRLMEEHQLQEVTQQHLVDAGAKYRDAVEKIGGRLEEKLAELGHEADQQAFHTAIVTLRRVVDRLCVAAEHEHCQDLSTMDDLLEDVEDVEDLVNPPVAEFQQQQDDESMEQNEIHVWETALPEGYQALAYAMLEEERRHISLSRPHTLVSANAHLLSGDQASDGVPFCRLLLSNPTDKGGAAPAPCPATPEPTENEQQQQQQQPRDDTPRDVGPGLSIDEELRRRNPNWRLPANAQRWNFMVCGESGLGKTTFIEMLHRLLTNSDADLLRNRVERNGEGPTTSVSEVLAYCLLETTGGRLNSVTDYHFYDSPGYGDNIDNTDAFAVIVNDLVARHTKYNKLREGPYREEKYRQFEDERIHAVLYFVPPNRFHMMDAMFIWQLSPWVAIIPMLAKADTLSIDLYPHQHHDRHLPVRERDRFRAQTRRDIEAICRVIYSDDGLAFADDECAVYALHSSIEGNRVPLQDRDMFFIIAATQLRRKFHWGTPRVQNEKHCDLTHFVHLLFRGAVTDPDGYRRLHAVDSHLQNLRHVTNVKTDRVQTTFLYRLVRVQQALHVLHTDWWLLIALILLSGMLLFTPYLSSMVAGLSLGMFTGWIQVLALDLPAFMLLFLLGVFLLSVSKELCRSLKRRVAIRFGLQRITTPDQDLFRKRHEHPNNNDGDAAAIERLSETVYRQVLRSAQQSTRTAYVLQTSVVALLSVVVLVQACHSSHENDGAEGSSFSVTDNAELCRKNVLGLLTAPIAAAFSIDIGRAQQA